MGSNESTVDSVLVLDEAANVQCLVLHLGSQLQQVGNPEQIIRNIPYAELCVAQNKFKICN